MSYTKNKPEQSSLCSGVEGVDALDVPKCGKKCYKKEKPAELKLLTAGVSKPYEKDILGVLPVGIELSQPKQVGSEREAL